ncbi:MAG: hypothetical protein K2Q23_18740 [Bryobacteraceae bacterium]|nr:hypothetical protein [Bryobacteraceae bacterium]
MWRGAAWLCFPLVLSAQIGDLRTSEDGSWLLFSHRLDQATRLFLFNGQQLNRIDGNVRLPAQPSLSRDGKLAGYSDQIFDAGTQRGLAFPGERVRLSYDGRYALLEPNLTLLDRVTTLRASIAGSTLIGDGQQAIGRNGLSLVTVPGSNVVTITSAGLTAFGTPTRNVPVRGRLISARFSWELDGFLYEAQDVGSTLVRLVWVSLPDLRETLLHQAPARGVVTTSFFQPWLTPNGDRVLYLRPDDRGIPQVAVQQTDGTNLRWLTSFADGIREAVISGNGQVVWALTVRNTLLRLLVDSRLPQLYLGTVPNFFIAEGSPVPGSMLQARLISSVAFNETLPPQLLINGQIYPWNRRNPGDNFYANFPDQLALGGRIALRFRALNDPLTLDFEMGEILPERTRFFETARDFELFVLALHGFSLDRVTVENPARANGLVTLLMTGLDVYRVPLRCDQVILNERRPLEITEAGFAWGRGFPEGIHVLQVRLPSRLLQDRFTISCGGSPPGIIPVAP